MNERLLHTPEGVRDIYNAECAKKMRLEQTLHHCLHLYGFEDIQTPVFEFFDIFNEEMGTVSAKETYRFFDREGNTLVLRPDHTPSIARCMAKYYKEETMPVRFCYCGSTFVNNSAYQGKLKESTQLGAELINDASVEADAEMLALTVESLLAAGLTKFQVEVGHTDFFRGLMEEAKLKEEEIETLRVLIENKNVFALEELISDKELTSSLKDVILMLPNLFGNLENVLKVRDNILNPKALQALERLESIYTLMKEYGLEQYITFDLGMLSQFNYYTGIIFRGFTLGTGDAIVTGGRYDSLLSHFGKEAPAIGMAVLVDQLMLALSRQQILAEPKPDNTLIVYKKEFRTQAISLAKKLRSRDKKVELYLAKDKTEAELVAYADRMNLLGMYFIHEEDAVSYFDVSSATWQKKTFDTWMN